MQVAKMHWDSSPSSTKSMSIDTQVCFRGDALVGSWAFITHHHCERICSCPTGWFSDFSKYFTVHYFFKLYNLSRISVEIAGGGGKKRICVFLRFFAFFTIPGICVFCVFLRFFAFYFDFSLYIFISRLGFPPIPHSLVHFALHGEIVLHFLLKLLTNCTI